MRMKKYSFDEMKKVLTDNGFEISHRKSSHVSFKKEKFPLVITVPQEKGELSRPLCKRLLKEAGIC